PGDRARSEGARRCAADAGAGRRRDRVPAPSDRRRARRGPGDPAHLARARGDPLALRPDPRPLRGADRRRARPRGLRGRDRLRDARRAWAGGRVSTVDRSVPPAVPPEESPGETLSARLAVRQRAGGIAVPAVTVIVAFLIGGVVVLATGHNPLLAY